MKINEFKISKHRYYELKHFCLQYPEWKELYFKAEKSLGIGSDPTGFYASIMADLKTNIEMVEKTSKQTDKVLGPFILEHVTLGTPYDILHDLGFLPCGKDLFYAYLHKFYYLLSIKKG
jgi:hypothetical protein